MPRIKWKDSVRGALRRYCGRRKSRIVNLHRLVAEEIGQIVADIRSRGATPDATLRRELQELAHLGELEFVDNNGTYRYLGDY